MISCHLGNNRLILMVANLCRNDLTAEVVSSVVSVLVKMITECNGELTS